MQKYVFKQQSSARTALGSSRPERLICRRRRSYIPATVHFMKYPFRHKLMVSQYNYLKILTVRRGSNPAVAKREHVANETANPLATCEVYSDWLRSLHSAGHRSLQIRKQAAQSGRRSSAQRLLCPLCAGEPENAKQPGFTLSPLNTYFCI